MSDFTEQKHQEMLLTQAQSTTSDGINTSLSVTEMRSEPTTSEKQESFSINAHSSGAERRFSTLPSYPGFIFSFGWRKCGMRFVQSGAENISQKIC